MTRSFISCRQYGVPRGLGTADLLTAVQFERTQAIGRGGCFQTLAADIAGAFDKVSHLGVLHKMREMGVTGLALNWLLGYLSTRHLQVTICGRCSSLFPVRAGVPQGSIRGPTLFLIYVNDVHKCLAPGTDMGVYADDTTLYTIARSKNCTAAQSASLQQSLTSLHACGQKWKVQFEPTKSQCVTIFRHQPQQQPPSPVVSDQQVPHDHQLKLLGVLFDDQLSYRAHLRQVSLRANSRLGSLCRTSKYLSTAGQIRTYRGFVRPLLEYAQLAWMGAAPTHLHQLDRVQRRALHIIGPNTILQSLASRRHVTALSFPYKLLCMSGPDQLTAMVPPLHPPPGPARTRSNHRVQVRYAFQLSEQLPAAAPNFLRRVFPHCTVHTWNTLLPSLLSHAPCLKSLQSFKEAVNRYLRLTCWLWPTDSI